MILIENISLKIIFKLFSSLNTLEREWQIFLRSRTVEKLEPELTDNSGLGGFIVKESNKVLRN